MTDVLSESEVDKVVANYISTQGTWNWDIICRYLPKNIYYRIMAISFLENHGWEN